MPTVLIPGNHDPQELFQRHLRASIDTAFDHQGVRFLLFNNSRTDSHNGFTYKLGGQVETQFDSEGALTTQAYNGFGELETRTQRINATQNRVWQAGRQ